QVAHGVTGNAQRRDLGLAGDGKGQLQGQPGIGAAAHGDDDSAGITEGAIGLEGVIVYRHIGNLACCLAKLLVLGFS
ncbi:hypothetical protein, partial [Klebsiella pneumoniae]|uniref:hypothetical protein n=1 Tax=Klebsiella pneumoniae TaxID=573 RepID=UPI00272F302B